MENSETNFSQQTIEEGKTIALIAYLTVIGLIIAFVMNNDKKNPFAIYHVRQVIGLVVTGIGSFIIGLIPFIGWIASIAISILIIVMWISGLLNALNGQAKPMPVLGKKFEEWFKGIN